jgi:hypothetical protein
VTDGVKGDVQSRGTTDSEHRRHDRLLVTRYAGGDAYPTERSEAEALVASCTQCAELAADIRLLVSRTRTLPDARRTRDFRISPEQAEQLRGSWLERLMHTFSTPRWSVARPVAGAAFALGLALAVVGTLPVATPFAATAPELDAPAPTSAPVFAPQPTTGRTTESTPAPEAAPPDVAAPGQQFPTEAAGDGSPTDKGNGPGEAQALASDDANLDQVYLQVDPSQAPAGEFRAARDSSAPSSSWLIPLGLLLAAVALGLLLVVTVARRRFADPLLR